MVWCSGYMAKSDIVLRLYSKLFSMVLTAEVIWRNLRLYDAKSKVMSYDVKFRLYGKILGMMSKLYSEKKGKRNVFFVYGDIGYGKKKVRDFFCI